jgi:hypothetical protein
MKRRSKVFLWLGAGFLSLLLASIAIPAFTSVAQLAQSTRDHQDGGQIWLALQSYAADHNGHFPNTLSELVPEYLREDFNKIPNGKFGLRLDQWFYFPNAPKDDPQAILLVSPRVYEDGSKFEPAPLITQPRFLSWRRYYRVVITRDIAHDMELDDLSETEFNNRMTKQLQADRTPVR